MRKLACGPRRAETRWPRMLPGRGRSPRARTSSAMRSEIHCSIEYAWRMQRVRSLAENPSLKRSMM